MARGPKPLRRTFRYWLQQLHLWVGLILLLPLVMMGITGAVLVYAHDIEHLLGQGDPPVKTAGEWQSAAKLIEAAKAANSEPGRIPIAVRWPIEVGEPAAVRLSRPGMANERPQFRGGQQGGQQGGQATGAPAQGRVPMQSPFAGSLQILIDPVSLQVLETQQAMTGWVRFFHDLHGHIFIPGGVGREIVGWLGVAMLVLGCSGLYLWWPKPGQWKAAFQVRRKAKGLRLNRELHGAVGIWSLAIFMLVNFTGVYLAFPQQISAAVNTVWPGRDMRAAMFQARVEPMRGTAPMDVDEAVELARARVPGTRFLNAFLSVRPDQALRVGLIRPGHEEGAPIVTVIVDPYRKSVVDVFDPQAMSTGEKIIAWQRALHYGIGLGGVYKFLVFVSGVIIPIFAVTGFLMWWIKRRNRRAGERTRQAILRGTGQPAE
ncbi:PepSY domain-containing protein [Reyranella sp. MMS21-HV4-11]|uniref:PepSY domain-containing protein n=1 Tax=Reyranella humidisoli TaxID=2849149 RepID=A0ABS6ICG9_9HYPH|nr:PepSY-associated TM helix domain-containing protein [Reyranella sp. MMS21-HV4-11]MBU8872306.1 PepSY domain-containing protein [Reyranella sp. MMS21-HV4-11]